MSRISMGEQLADRVGFTKAHIIAPNTCQYTDVSGYVCTRFHKTDIAISDGKYLTLFSGGYRTKTTKERLSLVLDLYHTGLDIFADKGNWYISKVIDDKSKPFSEGIKINLKTLHIIRPQGADQDIKERVKIHKLITAYVKGLKLWLVDNPVPLPEPGDCIVRQLRFGGDDTDHLLSHLEERYYSHLEERYYSHLEERYYMGSLIVKALELRGRGNPSFIIQAKVHDIIIHDVRWYLKKKFHLS